MTETPLFRARDRAGLTQEAAAAAWTSLWPDEPKSGKAIHYWETGKRAASVAVLQRLATVYGCRVGELVEEGPAPHVAALAVVREAGAVLLVQRADTLAWQLPAGTVKPDGDPERVVVRETRAETGVSVAVARSLGARVHPATKVLCRYFACDYLAGDVVNGDPEENADVVWAPLERLPVFIPTGLFGPVAEYLGAACV